VVGSWSFGLDIDDEPAVISTTGNWLWRGISGERLAQHAAELAELARQMIDAGH
jgi:hypothetical protein